MSAKQALNNKLQGSVAAYLRCSGVVNNQIKKGLLRVKKNKIGESLAKLQERDCLMYFARLAKTLLKDQDKTVANVFALRKLYLYTPFLPTMC